VEAVLRSNRGTSALTLRLAPRSSAEWDCALGWIGEHWADGQGRPFTGAVDGFVLTTAGLEAVHRHLVSWLDGPLDALVSSRLDASFDLAAPLQTFAFRFGPVDGVINERGKPVVGLAFSIGALMGNVHLVTDPSCLALFAESLADALHGGQR